MEFSKSVGNKMTTSTYFLMPEIPEKIALVNLNCVEFVASFVLHFKDSNVLSYLNVIFRYITLQIFSNVITRVTSTSQ